MLVTPQQLDREETSNHESESEKYSAEQLERAKLTKNDITWQRHNVEDSVRLVTKQQLNVEEISNREDESAASYIEQSERAEKAKNNVSRGKYGNKEECSIF